MMDQEALASALKESMEKVYEEKEKVMTPELLRMLERAVLLQVVDQQWKDHLLTMDHLKEGIGLQAYGQKDPLIEYKKEGFVLFQEMVHRVKEDALRLIFLTHSVSSRDDLFEISMPTRVKEEHPEFNAQAASAQAPPAMAPAPMGLMGGNTPPMGAPMGAPMGGQPWEMPPEGSPQGPPQRVQTIRRDAPKVGRNDPCYCGSGKKFKKCHGA